MKFIKAAEKPWQEKQGYSKKIFLTEEDLKAPGSLVQLIKIRPGDVAEVHYHKKQTEIFYFLDSNGFFIVGGEKIVPRPGDVIVIEPGDRHEVTNNSEADFIYVAFKVNYDKDDLYWGE